MDFNVQNPQSSYQLSIDHYVNGRKEWTATMELTQRLLFYEGDQGRGPDRTLKEPDQRVEDPSAVVFVVHSAARKCPTEFADFRVAYVRLRRDVAIATNGKTR